MDDPDLRPTDLATMARPAGRGLLLVDLGGLLARLLPSTRRGNGQGTGFGAGYALRRRQEENRQRLACPACRPPARERQGS
jgi:hypothetical protein